MAEMARARVLELLGDRKPVAPGDTVRLRVTLADKRAPVWKY
jgi:hypothetical protein